MSFKAMKIRIKDEEHSKKVQEALFKMGYKWASCSTDIINTDAKALYTDVDGYIWYSSRDWNDDNNFAESKEPEHKLLFGVIVKVVHIPDPEFPQIVIDDTHGTLPVLGLTPRELHLKDRLIEVLEAMLRFAKVGMIIPDEWDDEYDELREYLNAEYQKELNQNALMNLFKRAA